MKMFESRVHFHITLTHLNLVNQAPDWKPNLGSTKYIVEVLIMMFGLALLEEYPNILSG
jgi:hypothetical protein